MQLKNDLAGINLLNETIASFYKKHGSRDSRNFLQTEDPDWGWSYTHFLIDRKHVIRYSIGQDRGFWVGGVDLAIGPHYFGPAAFWSYENSQRFSIESNTESVEKNLRLLDEFLGYANRIL